MTCPKFIDNTRECINKIKVMPINTLGYCTTSKYINCPFYLVLTGNRDVCRNVGKCPAFRNFQMYDFEEFVKISNEYCVSKNHANCKRFKLKETGKEVPINLHPDGHIVAEWK